MRDLAGAGAMAVRVVSRPGITSRIRRRGCGRCDRSALPATCDHIEVWRFAGYLAVLVASAKILG